MTKGNEISSSTSSSSSSRARKDAHSSRGVVRSPATPLAQEKERRATRKEKVTNRPVAASTNGCARHHNACSRPSAFVGDGATPPKRRSHRRRSGAEEAEETNSHASSSAASSSSPLLHPAGSSAGVTPPRKSAAVSSLLSTLPVYRGATAAAPVLKMEKGGLSSTYTPAVSNASTPSKKRHSCACRCPSPPLHTLQDYEGKPTEKGRRRDSTRKHAAPTADKPWLSKPEGGGILKSRKPSPLRTDSIEVTSTPTEKNLLLSATAPPLISIGTTTPRSASAQNLEHSRHVRFDEANIEYLGAFASRIIYSDSQLGVQLSNEEWGAVMMSPTSAHEYSAARRPDTGTTVSMGKAKPSAWGGDSEWFNAEFGSQMELHTDHSDLPSPALTPAALGAPCSALSARSMPSSLLTAAPPSGSASPFAPTAQALLTPAIAHANGAELTSASATGFVRQRPQLEASTNTKGLHHKEKEEPRRPPTPPVCPRNRNSTSTATPEESEGETRCSSPVLVYERAPLSTTAGPPSTLSKSQTGVNALRCTVSPMDASTFSTHSANDALTPAPPHTLAGSLRRHSSSAQSSPSTSPTLQGTMGGSSSSHSYRRSSGSRPRLSSPGVSFANVDLRGLNMDDDFEALGGAEEKGSVHATASPPPPLHDAALLAGLAAGGDVDGAGVGDSPSTRALQLSASERRLLRAVMHINTQHGPTRSPNSVRATPVASTPVTDSKGKGSGVHALRASVRTLGDPCEEVLSSDIRQFLEGDGKRPIREKKQ
ncbi:hypothetical protein ABB37_04743 [Leptomonas pyrrhocoris]|uniref:Uncharacterized protein n=1 Tax=Leptomonas pyrrhocoris TaxID=157538 RepID=A0A0M9G1V2_LEPPY|nr:hypothetical protein ABB37_04743 [Leptomonas pyrrhocoris]KPA80533.1 hypothetical protein ABB37_04743 [Leptomonas pyrrhocoris]|eukprot:XP_015658972.1 hypothetical protein ABB37_04743 [Leptomonas pyrrhocoris]